MGQFLEISGAGSRRPQRRSPPRRLRLKNFGARPRRQGGSQGVAEQIWG